MLKVDDVLQQQVLPTNTQTIATLPGFQSQHSAYLSLLGSNMINGPKSIDEARHIWEKAQKCSQRPPRHPFDSSLTIKTLPDEFQEFEQELKARPTYKRNYESVGDYQLVLVPLCHLITSQWCVNLDYIEGMKQQMPQLDDFAGILSFCFKDEIIPDPVLEQPNGPASGPYLLTFPRSQGLSLNQPVALHPIDQGDSAKRDISFSIVARGNYPQVAKIQDALVVINGTHHLSALIAAEWEYAPVLLRSATSTYDCGFNLNDHGIIHDPQKLARPPLLCDFFDEEIAFCYQQPVMDIMLQAIVQFNVVRAIRG